MRQSIRYLLIYRLICVLTSSFPPSIMRVEYLLEIYSCTSRKTAPKSLGLLFGAKNRLWLWAAFIGRIVCGDSTASTSALLTWNFSRVLCLRFLLFICQRPPLQFFQSPCGSPGCP